MSSALHSVGCEQADNLHLFRNNTHLAEELAERIATDLQSAIDHRNKATLAVSGGSESPRLFEYLSRLSVDWARVTIAQVDERWVDEKHTDSNARLIRDHLLQRRAAKANFISMKTEHFSPFDAEEAAAEKLSAFAQSIDVAVLGMGVDGHTASFFPHIPSLIRAMSCDAQQLCAAVSAPMARHRRMTLTLPALLRSQRLYLHIAGKQKWEVLQRAQLPAGVEELPVRSVLTLANTPPQIFYAREN